MSMICTHFMREMKEQRGKQMYVFLPSIKVGGRAACYVELWAIRVNTRACHGNQSGFSVRNHKRLIFEMPDIIKKYTWKLLVMSALQMGEVCSRQAAD